MNKWNFSFSFTNLSFFFCFRNWNWDETHFDSKIKQGIFPTAIIKSPELTLIQAKSLNLHLCSRCIVLVILSRIKTLASADIASYVLLIDLYLTFVGTDDETTVVNFLNIATPFRLDFFPCLIQSMIRISFPLSVTHHSSYWMFIKSMHWYYMKYNIIIS